ncbi:hypothetical protein FACS1894200_03370 [Spirochaetia bacterium]|nr:hypothetical protein FACS1894200_03370 [Spirochaetia bacterium]
MKQVSIQDAIGKRLAHDLSRFVDGDNERTPFRRGHLVTKEDIPHLLSMGNEHENENNGKIHEGQPGGLPLCAGIPAL